MTRLLPVALVVASASALQLLGGCSQSAIRGKAAVSAPTLTDGGQAHIRGVSDPNAPFTLIDRSQTAASPRSAAGSSSAALCLPGNLQVYEAAASMNGASRVLTLAIKNRGASTCRLSGYPSIVLQDESGSPIASIAVRQTGALAVSGSVVAPVASTVSASALNEVSAKPAGPGEKVDIVLIPSSSADFQIGWSSGGQCPLVSSFSVALSPANSASGEAVRGDDNHALSAAFIINHALNVCNSEILVTSLRSGGAI